MKRKYQDSHENQRMSCLFTEEEILRKEATIAGWSV